MMVVCAHGTIEIGPSLLAADPLDYGREIDDVSSADYLHVDVMDAHFARDLSWGPSMVEAFVRRSAIPVEVHIMLDEPNLWIEPYARAGAQRMVIHIESIPSQALESTILKIRGLGCEAALAISPFTRLEVPPATLRMVDGVMIMGVVPGEGGSGMLPSTVDRVASMAMMLSSEEYDLPDMRIAVDGGVKRANIAALVRAGATRFVAGTEIFRGDDRRGRIEALRQAACSA